jgi:hypothetical protein
MDFSCEEKSMYLIKNVKVRRWLVYILHSLAVTRLIKYRNDEGCQHSKSAPASFLHYLPSGKILVLFFLLPRKVQFT